MSVKTHSDSPDTISSRNLSNTEASSQQTRHPNVTSDVEDPAVPQQDVTFTNPESGPSIQVHKLECTLSEASLDDIAIVRPDVRDGVERMDTLPHYRLTVVEFFTMSGFGKFQYLHALCFVFVFIRDGMEVIYAALIKPSLACLWELSALEGALIPALPALTYAIGSQIVGIATDKFGRKPALMFCLCLTLVLDIGTAFSDNYVLFIVLRSSSAFFLGGAFGTVLTTWTEIVPKTKRFKSLFYFALFWTTGTAVAVLDAWFMDKNDRLDYHFFILILCIPTTFAFGFSFLVYETASYYIVAGKVEKAIELIKEVIEMNKMEPASYDVLCEGTRYNRGAVIKLFQMPYAKVSLCFMAISYSVGWTFGGWTVLVSNLFSNEFCTVRNMYTSTNSFCKALTNEAYFLIFLAVLGGYPGYISAYNIAKKTGPMNYVSVTYFTAFYLFVLLNFCLLPFPASYYLFYSELFLTRALLGGGYLMLWLYTPVYYHTQIRAVGVGLGICFLKLGTASAAILIAYLDFPCKIYSFAAFSLVVMTVAVMVSEPQTRAALFAETEGMIETRDLDELYKHHHVPQTELTWHIRNIQLKEKRKKQEAPVFATNQGDLEGQGGPDFNWVDITPYETTITTTTKTPNYTFSVNSSETADVELPISAFFGRKVYSDVPTPGKPTFYFDRSKYPRPIKGKGKYHIRPLSASGCADEDTYILTPTGVRSEGNTPDPNAAFRDQVIVKRTLAETKAKHSSEIVYENVKKRNKRSSSGSGNK